MKTAFFTTVFVALVCSAGSPGAEEGVARKPVTTELHVTGMSCHNCADAVEDVLAALDGVEVVSVDPKGNLAVVKWTPGKVTRAMMVAAIKGTDEYVLEQTVEYSRLEYENDGSFSLDGKAFTGTATDVHKKSGNQSKNYQFKDGKLHGLIREWYDDGQMAAKKFYKEGKRHGKTEYWGEDGKLTATKIYKDDEHVDEEGNTVEE
jgi:antitoxin component YwqK of YwqJK toxin-antitoxin module